MVQIDLRVRSIEHFSQLILLLVNIIQGISLAQLAQKLVVIDVSLNVDYALYLRLLACLVIIWFITFQYAVVVVTLWFANNGVRDIFCILILGIAEYGTMNSVLDAEGWLKWLIAAIASGILCFLSTIRHATKMIKETPNPIFIETKRHATGNLVHVIVCGAVLLAILLAPRASPAISRLFQIVHVDFVVPILIIGYCLYVLWDDSKYIKTVFLSPPEAGRELQAAENG
jgi:hypothetical protein